MRKSLEMPGIFPKEIPPLANLKLQTRDVRHLRDVRAVLQNFARSQRQTRLRSDGVFFRGRRGSGGTFPGVRFRFRSAPWACVARGSRSRRRGDSGRRLACSPMQPIKSAASKRQRGNRNDSRSDSNTHALFATRATNKPLPRVLPSYNTTSRGSVGRLAPAFGNVFERTKTRAVRLPPIVLFHRMQDARYVRVHRLMATAPLQGGESACVTW